jgi:hypothetical protein
MNDQELDRLLDLWEPPPPRPSLRDGLRAQFPRTDRLGDLVNFVQNWTDRTLLDETGLKGLYHIETEPWRPMDSIRHGQTWMEQRWRICPRSSPCLSGSG